jgi:hypothetical protein
MLHYSYTSNRACVRAHTHTRARAHTHTQRHFKAGAHERCIDVRSTHASSNGRWVPVQTSVAWRALCQLHDGRHRVASLSYLVWRMLKQRHRSRRWWVHPMNSERYLRGQFYTWYPRLREDSNKFCQILTSYSLLATSSLRVYIILASSRHISAAQSHPQVNMIQYINTSESLPRLLRIKHW